MRRIITIFQIAIVTAIMVGATVIGMPRTGLAAAASGPSLVISQLKITSSNGQFVTLYNATDADLDMSKFQLEYFNSYDLSKSTSSRLIALSGIVSPHGYFMVNDDSVTLCYQMGVDSVSLGLSSASGMLEVTSSDQPAAGGAVSTVLQDYVSWSKSSVGGVQTLPSKLGAFLQRNPVDAGSNPAITLPGAGTWQAVEFDSNNQCRLVSLTNPSSVVPTGIRTLLPGGLPPATIISVNQGSGQAAAALPSSDIGLKAPVVNELLPNPNGSGNDSTNEFVELYNSNATSFDLSGFSLEAGITTKRHYVFPEGTKMLGHSFTAFYSATTDLSLSNSGSQVRLLDPFGNSISTSSQYGAAKDGNAWALANGKWYWSSQPTPGRQNIIKQPVSTKKVSAKKTSTKKAATKLKSLTSASSSGDDAADNMSPVHLWTLAIVGCLAILYGAYEYRADIGNRLNQFKRNFAHRRRDGA